MGLNITVLSLLITCFTAVASFADVNTRIGIESDFSPAIKPADVVAVHGSCAMNDHVRTIHFEFTNLQSPPGDFDFLKHDFKATYQLRTGGSFQFLPSVDAESVLSLGWQDRGRGLKSKWILAFFGKSGPESEGLFIDAFDWTSPFEFSSDSKKVTITTKSTWIRFYDPKRVNNEPLTGGDCKWVLTLK